MRSLIQPGARFFTALAALLVVCFPAQALDLFPRRKEPGHGIFGTAGRQDKKSSSAHMLQQEMMDFSDRYTMAIWQALDEYVRGENDPLKRSAAEHWKVLFSAASMEIAVERQPAVSLLDMAVLMELADWVVGKYWVPEVFGSRGSPLLRTHKSMLKDIDVILDRTLTPEQRSELRSLVQTYKKEHPRAVYVADVRLRDLALARAGQDRSSVGIPLLADVSRAVGEMDEALQYGERLMFYVERISRSATMQTSLALSQAASSPAVLSLTRSAETASLAIDRVPSALSLALKENTEVVKEVLPSIQATVSDTRVTVESAERIMNALGQSPPAAEPWTPTKTLSALTEVRLVASEWNVTLKQAESTLARLETGKDPAMNLLAESETQIRKSVDYAYSKALVAIAVFLCGQAAVVAFAAWMFKRR